MIFSIPRVFFKKPLGKIFISQKVRTFWKKILSAEKSGDFRRLRQIFGLLERSQSDFYGLRKSLEGSINHPENCLNCSVTECMCFCVLCLLSVVPIYSTFLYCSLLSIYCTRENLLRDRLLRSEISTFKEIVFSGVQNRWFSTFNSIFSMSRRSTNLKVVGIVVLISYWPVHWEIQNFFLCRDMTKLDFWKNT